MQRGGQTRETRAHGARLGRPPPQRGSGPAIDAGSSGQEEAQGGRPPRPEPLMMMMMTMTMMVMM
eukprot:8141662-Lingulodinium_polyedra.AAC.1